jgi:RNA polymerase-binding transcription factor DksA
MNGGHCRCAGTPATPGPSQKDIRVRTHTYQYKLTCPVPGSTPPEHQPTTEDTPGTWDRSRTQGSGRTAAAEAAPLDATLAELERKREEQLASLEDAEGDLVAIAYKNSVARILEEIRTARRRLREGKHGMCVDCHGRVAAERIEALPWATQCTDCVRRRYS